MSNNVIDLLDAVTRLSPVDLTAFRELYAELDTKRWNHHLAQNVATGLPALLIQEAKQDYYEERYSDC